MNTKKRYALIFGLALLGGAALVAVTWAAPGNAPLAQGGAPAVVSYQGEVRVGGTPYTGDGHFKFAVVNAAGNASYWSNDGTSTSGGEPTAGVGLVVSEGLFSVLLGDTTLGGMTQALAADVFSQPDCYLRVWFSTSVGGPFSQLTADTRIAAVPYALQAQEAADADTVDGLHASELGADYQNVVVVAKSGGDYTSVQTAIDSVDNAAADNPYLVWVAPGVYSETVTMKPYVHLQGAGQEATVISSTASSSAWPPTQATLVLASDTSLRDLTVGNSGAGHTNAALLATAGMTRTLAADVTARALGGGVTNLTIVLSGSGTGVTLQQVTALAENGSGSNIGLFNVDSAAATLRGGAFTGRGGNFAFGIMNVSSATLAAESVTALGENSITHTYGLDNIGGAAAVLRGGSFTARGGGDANWGINNAQPGTTLEAESVTALAENGSVIGYIIGLDNHGAATVMLHGGSFTARGGANTKGIHNANATLEAESVTVLAENGSNTNYGLDNDEGVATLRGGAFTGRGGGDACGIMNVSSATLEAESVTALAENGSDNNYGLNNFSGAAATLRGGSFTGRAGVDAWGIYNDASGTTLEAESVAALAENGSSNNYGLYNFSGAEATLRGGVFTGRGGTEARGISNNSGSTLEAESVTASGENGSSYSHGLVNYGAAALRGGVFTGHEGTHARGIYNANSGVTLVAEGVTALGKDGSSTNYGLHNGSSATADVTQGVLEGATNSVYRTSGSVTVSNSRLAGSAVSGTVTCVLVTRGTTISTDGSTCP